MGTGYSVKLGRLPATADVDTLRGEIETTLAEINALMSTYLADSELSRFNASRTTDWVEVSFELRFVVAEALRVSELSDGRFDVTVGPLVDAWGFGPTWKDEPPAEATIAELMSRVGYEKVATREDPPALRKAHAKLAIDLSAIAKGYAVDRLADLLESQGVSDYLVEIGGELRVRGVKPDGSPWRVAIERPVIGRRAVQRILVLADCAIATSGDYRNFFEHDGQRYAHVLDPTTGRPVTHTLASVSVITDTALYSDSLATALMVAGPDAGMELAESLGVAAAFIVRTPGGFEERFTQAFGPYLGRTPAH